MPDGLTRAEVEKTARYGDDQDKVYARALLRAWDALEEVRAIYHLADWDAAKEPSRIWDRVRAALPQEAGEEP